MRPFLPAIMKKVVRPGHSGAARLLRHHLKCALRANSMIAKGFAPEMGTKVFVIKEIRMKIVSTRPKRAS
jgi:hypothetical protein